MPSDIFQKLFDVVEARKSADPDASYVAKLYAKGLPKITGKLIEEAGETVEAAYEDDAAHLTYELADLFFHAIVLAGYKNIALADIEAELDRRFGVSGITEKENRGK